MDCLKPEISLLLSDYFTGHLGPVDKELVENHLSDCRICRLSLRTMLLISGKRKTDNEAVDGQHFSPQLLGRFHSDPQSLDRRLIQQIESHLAICQECSEDMSFLQNSDLDLRALIEARRSNSKWSIMLGRLKKLIGIESQ